MRTPKHLNEMEQLQIQILFAKRMQLLFASILFLMLLGLMAILFWLLFHNGRLQDQDHGRVSVNSPADYHQVRPSNLINGISSDASDGYLVTKKAACRTAGGFLMHVKKVTFETVSYSKPFESRQPEPDHANYGHSGCLFYGLFSDQWHFLPQRLKPLPRGCNSFMDRFLSNSDGIIDMMNHGNGLGPGAHLLVHHSDYYSGIAL